MAGLLSLRRGRFSLWTSFRDVTAGSGTWSDVRRWSGVGALQSLQGGPDGPAVG